PRGAMDGVGHSTNQTHRISRLPLTTRRTVWAATSPHRKQTGFTCRVIQCWLQSRPAPQREEILRDTRGEAEKMRRYASVLALIAIAVAMLGTLFLFNSGRVAAETQQQSAAVFDADGKLKLPTGFRKWVFVGAPLTPNGLNNGKAGFPEYHHLYVEQKNVDAYLKTGSFPEGTVFVKELTRVLNPTF